MLKIIGMIVLTLLILLHVAPCLVPVTEPVAVLSLPFTGSRFEAVDGITLHYSVWKPAEKKTKGKVLLVHGLGGSTFSWRNNVAALTEEGYFVMAVDLPGIGSLNNSTHASQLPIYLFIRG